MVNVETVRFIGIMKELAKLSENGIFSFSKCNEKNRNDYIFYDDTKKNEDDTYKIVCDSCVDELHHDIISYYGEDDYIIGVVVHDEDDVQDIFVQVRMNNNVMIVIENGDWHLV